jgi:hypothetical protein
MPCYQVNTVTLEFKAKNSELIIKTLEEMNLRPEHHYVARTQSQWIDTRIGRFNLDTGTVETRDYNADIVNKFRRKYSENVIKVAAKAKKWVVKKRSQNQYVAKKW